MPMRDSMWPGTKSGVRRGGLVLGVDEVEPWSPLYQMVVGRSVDSRTAATQSAPPAARDLIAGGRGGASNTRVGTFCARAVVAQERASRQARPADAGSGGIG